MENNDKYAFIAQIGNSLGDLGTNISQAYVTKKLIDANKRKNGIITQFINQSPIDDGLNFTKATDLIPEVGPTVDLVNKVNSVDTNDTNSLIQMPNNYNPKFNDNQGFSRPINDGNDSIKSDNSNKPITGLLPGVGTVADAVNNKASNYHNSDSDFALNNGVKGLLDKASGNKPARTATVENPNGWVNNDELNYRTRLAKYNKTHKQIMDNLLKDEDIQYALERDPNYLDDVNKSIALRLPQPAKPDDVKYVVLPDGSVLAESNSGLAQTGIKGEDPWKKLNFDFGKTKFEYEKEKDGKEFQYKQGQDNIHNGFKASEIGIRKAELNLKKDEKTKEIHDNNAKEESKGLTSADLLWNTASRVSDKSAQKETITKAEWNDLRKVYTQHMPVILNNLGLTKKYAKAVTDTKNIIKDSGGDYYETFKKVVNGQKDLTEEQKRAMRIVSNSSEILKNYSSKDEGN